MQIVLNLDIELNLKRSVATVGSFDGLHFGHIQILRRVLEVARLKGLSSMVITFEPHPRIVLHQDNNLKLLTTFVEKKIMLEHMGIDYLVVIPFNEQFSKLSKREFIEQYLQKRLNVSYQVVGYNHRFGKDNEGDYSFLTSYGDSFEVEQVCQQTKDNNKVSSTIIRNAIGSGDMSLATQLLSHPYIICGDANQRAEIVVDSYKQLPPNGLYVASIDNEECNIKIENRTIILPIQYSNRQLTIYLK